jgi:hypothetical protein
MVTRQIECDVLYPSDFEAGGPSGTIIFGPRGAQLPRPEDAKPWSLAELRRAMLLDMLADDSVLSARWCANSWRQATATPLRRRVLGIGAALILAGGIVCFAVVRTARRNYDS